jgi:hypothetical protein
MSRSAVELTIDHSAGASRPSPCLRGAPVDGLRPAPPIDRVCP